MLFVNISVAHFQSESKDSIKNKDGRKEALQFLVLEGR